MAGPKRTLTVEAPMQEIAFTSQIRTGLKNIDVLKEKLKTQKDMLKSALEQDAMYSEALAKVKEAKRALDARKEVLLKDEAIAVVKEDIKAITEEMKDEQLSLSDYLFSYVKTTNMQTVEDYNGEIRLITKTLSTKKANE